MLLEHTQIDRTEEYYQSLVIATGQIVWTMDAQGDMIDDQSNTSWRTFTGHTQAEAKGRGWMNALHPEDRERVAAIFAHAIKTCSVYDAEYRLRRYDGEYRFFRARGVPVLDKDGSVSEWVGSSLDITERRQTEEELQWKTAFLEAQVYDSIDGILVVDSRGKKILQNQQMADLWEIPPSIANDLDDERQLRFCTNQARHPQQFIEKVDHLYSHPNEICRDEIELKNGRVLDRYSSPVIDKNGKHYGRIWTFRDITERKQAEEALRKAHASLEQRVEERTAELKTANEQMKQVNRLLHILSECNQQVVRATEEKELLREICRTIVGPGGFPSVWIGFAEEDPGKTVRPVAQEGFEDGYLDTLKITWADTEQGQGPTGSAIRTGKPCVIKDIQTAINFAPWKGDAARLGYASAIGLPLWGNGKVFGALTK
ncbi:MAG: putative sensor protein [Pedosphaera sp.]|nr:putative sensor protein [Pedosphaera sp.]